MDNFYKKCKNLSKNERILGTDEAQIEQLKEQGRSMVEMLGVLAVVGVLSVGAISGYRYAMNKYRANQVTNELNLLSHQIGIAMMSKNGLSGKLTLGEPYDSGKLSSSGYNFAFGCGESGTDTPCQNQGKFHFEVQKVSEGVCKELLQMSEHLQLISSHPTNCESGENALNYVFEVEFVSYSGIEKEEEVFSSAEQATCFGNGLFVYGKCSCDAGYSGIFCQKEDSNCSGNGEFNEGRCSCKENYYGKNCQYSKIKCQEHGSFWNAGYGVCNCLGDYGGAECDIENACNGFGSWENFQGISSGRCYCSSDHYGENCTLTKDPCGEYGFWDSWQGACVCTDNYEGDKCDLEAGTICGSGKWTVANGIGYCS